MASADTEHAMHWKPLARIRTHEQVVAEIENRLLTGQLRAGDRLPPERQFAEALGVSRGAVREALRILDAVGVVDTGIGSGPSAGSMIVKDSAGGMAMVLRLHLQVSSFSRDDLLECRQMIGQLAARRAAESAGAEDIAALRSLAERMHGVRTGADLDDLETDFHARLAAISDNALAAILSNALRDAEKAHCAGPTDHLVPPVEDYARLVDAIAAGDGDAAATLLSGILLRDRRRPVGLSALRPAG